jgi:chromosomal replication initiation ATPase DnaA
MRKIEILVNNETFRILMKKARAEGLSVPDYVLKMIVSELDRAEGRDVDSRLERIERKLDAVLERLDGGHGRARKKWEKAGWESY